MLLIKQEERASSRVCVINQLGNSNSRLAVEPIDLYLLIFIFPIRYGNHLIPDGISISEIYDSEAHSVFFSDASQFTSYLSSSYGVTVTNEEMK